MSRTPVPPTGDEREQLGRRVRQLRQAKGLSARELAARSGLTSTYISRLENARLSPTVATLSRLGRSEDRIFYDKFTTTGEPEG